MCFALKQEGAHHDFHEVLAISKSLWELKLDQYLIILAEKRCCESYTDIFVLIVIVMDGAVDFITCSKSTTLKQYGKYCDGETDRPFLR